jgi:hypothetical protein
MGPAASQSDSEFERLAQAGALARRRGPRLDEVGLVIDYATHRSALYRGSSCGWQSTTVESDGTTRLGSRGCDRPALRVGPPHHDREGCRSGPGFYDCCVRALRAPRRLVGLSGAIACQLRVPYYYAPRCSKKLLSLE